MRYPQPHRNGGETQQNFHSTVSLQKLKRFNSLILVFRFSGFCFTLASAVFMFTNYGVSDSLDWLNFDAFSHDQVFAYLLLSASSAGTEMARAMKGTCTDDNVFCVQSDIAIALGFVGFLFSGVSALLSGFRVCEIEWKYGMSDVCVLCV
ncbi:hypothetical protein DKX38_012367 [Salix brachista]|uniref:CASP-like protein n=1 Tax=Salix brachista TaxID=2182728 RepID=A0A5N5LN82_9ROSI|nr:hypothetical protein DKX38_012367 [Salix brachista]